VEKRPRHTIESRKNMFTVIWGTNGCHVVDLMVEGISFDSGYFIDSVMTALI
jgi:hypothetical protein